MRGMHRSDPYGRLNSRWEAHETAFSPFPSSSSSSLASSAVQLSPTSDPCSPWLLFYSHLCDTTRSDDGSRPPQWIPTASRQSRHSTADAAPPLMPSTPTSTSHRARHDPELTRRRRSMAPTGLHAPMDTKHRLRDTTRAHTSTRGGRSRSRDQTKRLPVRGTYMRTSTTQVRGTRRRLGWGIMGACGHFSSELSS